MGRLQNGTTSETNTTLKRLLNTWTKFLWVAVFSETVVLYVSRIVMLAFVQRRVDSKSTIHCESLRGRNIADCESESEKMSLIMLNDMMKSFWDLWQRGT